MSEENKALCRQFYDRVSSGDLSVIDELVADDFVDYEEFGGIPPTKDGVRQTMQMFRTAFPDFQLLAEDMVAEGDKVCIRYRMRGTHQGEFMGIPATGRQVDVPGADVIRIVNGKAVEHWGVTDTGLLMQQLGVAEAPATA